MKDPMGEITSMMQNGAWQIAKILIKYILLPELAAAILFGLLLRLKGDFFKFAMFLVTLLSVYLFYKFGLPELTNNV